jgi:hypothetical protein
LLAHLEGLIAELFAEFAEVFGSGADGALAEEIEEGGVIAGERNIIGRGAGPRQKQAGDKERCQKASGHVGNSHRVEAISDT